MKAVDVNYAPRRAFKGRTIFMADDMDKNRQQGGQSGQPGQSGQKSGQTGQQNQQNQQNQQKKGGQGQNEEEENKGKGQRRASYLKGGQFNEKKPGLVS